MEGSAFSSVLEAIVAAFPPRISKVGKQTWNDHLKTGTPGVG